MHANVEAAGLSYSVQNETERVRLRHTWFGCHSVTYRVFMVLRWLYERPRHINTAADRLAAAWNRRAANGDDAVLRGQVPENLMRGEPREVPKGNGTQTAEVISFMLTGHECYFHRNIT